MTPMTLPWTGPGVPHAVLDINRGCDIRCRACYNARPASLKSLAAIDDDLDALSRLRRLHAVTIAGGEPLLHPGLVEVIRRLKGRGFVAALLTNGYAFDARCAAELAAAGLDLVLFHIDGGQRRGDRVALDVAFAGQLLHDLAELLKIGVTRTPPPLLRRDDLARTAALLLRGVVGAHGPSVGNRTRRFQTSVRRVAPSAADR